MAAVKLFFTPTVIKMLFTARELGNCPCFIFIFVGLLNSKTNNWLIGTFWFQEVTEDFEILTYIFILGSCNLMFNA